MNFCICVAQITGQTRARFGQVLISIQALVLCEQPYYNEAGYDKQLGTNEVHSRRSFLNAFSNRQDRDVVVLDPVQ